MIRTTATLCVLLCVLVSPCAAQQFPASLKTFFARHCNDCHAAGAEEGGLSLDKLSSNLKDLAVFARWERIFDRVRMGEMPPADGQAPSERHKQIFLEIVGKPLAEAHLARKGTVLRRLNRQEYENTLNDLFGTNADLAGMLPEDGRAHEFDNVGDALGLSMIHLQRYLDAINVVLSDAIAATTTAPLPTKVEATYAAAREGDQFIGKVWKLLDDGAVVRFSGGGYPSGMLRGSGVRVRGRYRVRVTGYAYQSDEPITFSVGGTSFARGSEKPIYGFHSFQPGEPQSLEFETWIERNYMIQIEPYGISDPDRYKRKSIKDYKGPGLAILKVELEGPLVGEFPSRGHRLLFDGVKRDEIPPRNPNDRKRKWYKPQFQLEFADERKDVANILTRVATAAFRRPAGDEDVEPFSKLYHGQRAEKVPKEEALRTAVSAIFCSPKFLYLQERRGTLDGYALATRLSYFLARTTPDEKLVEAAKAGQLLKQETLRAEVERLLEDDRFERFIEDFTDSWLDLREMDFTAPDSKLFPEFDQYLRYSMPRETRAFLSELIESNLPVSNLVKSDFAMLNGRLAQHYGLPPVAGAKLRRVVLDNDSMRGGLLSQASILKVTANGTNTSPVTRGAWVMERMMGQTPPPPPPGVAGVEPDIRGASTLRELLAKHRDLASCNACHKKIDPPGFALESFNPIGGLRERYRSIGGGDRVDRTVNGRHVNYRLGPAVDSSGEFADGRAFEGYREFRDHLADDSDLLARTFSEKLLTFATGRELGFSDREEVERLVRASAKNGHRIRDLIHLVVQSKIFRNK